MKEYSHGSGAYTYPPSPDPGNDMPPYKVLIIVCRWGSSTQVLTLQGDGYPPGCSRQDENFLHDAMTKFATVVNAKATGKADLSGSTC